nr:MAG TPA: hypothetical protein [Caudoviricetes sp.]
MISGKCGDRYNKAISKFEHKACVNRRQYGY